MLAKPKLRRVALHSSQNSLNPNKVEAATQGIHLLKNMHAEKLKIVPLPRCGTKGSRSKRSKQPVQQQMQKANPEEVAKPVCTSKPGSAQGTKQDDKKVVHVTSLTRKAISEHGEDISQDIYSKEMELHNACCLKNHAITPVLRSKMINWMIEVLNTFECEDQTFFLSVLILDSYYAHANKYFSILLTHRLLNADDIHLTGIVAMFIASKYVDYYPLKMKIVTEKIGHGAFAAESVKAKEREIMRTIQYDITFPTCMTFLDNLIENFADTHHLQMDDRHWSTLKRVHKICLYFAKMGLYEYKMLEYKYQET